MAKPSFYPFPADRVETHSTHISSVFVAGEFAFKIKKPLNLGFLDFSTLEKRRQACLDEVALNRRLAPDIYLDAVPIHRHPHAGYSLSPIGPPVEYAVKMKRLDGQGMFDVLLEQGRLRIERMEELAGIMADFHARADVGPRVDAFASPSALLLTWAEDLEQIRRHVPEVLPPEPISLVEAFARAFLRGNADLFASRIRQGKIRDCHGDLHLQNICLDKGKIRVFDCIEFNEKFRCMDVASEVAFLAMDLECRNAPDLAGAFVNAYVARSGDRDLENLLPFYKCYRALVRAKIMCLKANGEIAGGMAGRYAWLAAKYAAPFPSPALVCMAGITGSGKSALAQEISGLTGAPLHQSDALRKTLHGIAPTQKVREKVGQGIYDPGVTGQVYESLLSLARQDLEKGQSVILDATFTKAAYRKKAVDLARDCGAKFFLVVCQLPEKVARERILARAKDAQAISDGSLAVYEAQKKMWEDPVEIPPDRVITVETARPAPLLACVFLEATKL